MPARKHLAFVFQNVRDIILVGYFKKAITINREYYIEVLQQKSLYLKSYIIKAMHCVTSPLQQWLNALITHPIATAHTTYILYIFSRFSLQQRLLISNVQKNALEKKNPIMKSSLPLKRFLRSKQSPFFRYIDLEMLEKNETVQLGDYIKE